MNPQKLPYFQSSQPAIDHSGSVDVAGLEDLFGWASEVVAESVDPQTAAQNEYKVRRNLLEAFGKNKEFEAQEKYQEEISLLQKRAIALLQIISEKIEENGSLKQIMTIQYLAMQRIPDLEAEVKQLREMTWYRDEAEAERKHLMNALARLKKERDFLDELVLTIEGENTRLAGLLKQTRNELTEIQNRRWWHAIFPWLAPQ